MLPFAKHGRMDCCTCHRRSRPNVATKNRHDALRGGYCGRDRQNGAENMLIGTFRPSHRACDGKPIIAWMSRREGTMTRALVTGWTVSPASLPASGSEESSSRMRFRFRG